MAPQNKGAKKTGKKVEPDQAYITRWGIKAKRNDKEAVGKKRGEEKKKLLGESTRATETMVKKGRMKKKKGINNGNMKKGREKRSPPEMTTACLGTYKVNCENCRVLGAQKKGQALVEFPKQRTPRESNTQRNEEKSLILRLKRLTTSRT